MARLLPPIQRFMLRTNRGPLRALWRLAYAAAAGAYAAYVARGEAGASAYVRGTLASGETLPGLSDIDVEVVLAPSSDAAAARERVRRRFGHVQRALPGLADLLFDWPSVFEQRDLADVARQTVFTYGLDSEPARASYHGPGNDPQKTRLLERPELYGPARTWRRLSGPDRLPAAAPRDPSGRRLAAWLEVQNWWRWAFDACVHPDRPRTAHLCVKLVADPARAWLWLADGTEARTRDEALRLGRERLPRRAAAFEHALDLLDRLPSMPEPPLREVMPHLLELTADVAGEIARQVEPEGFTEVRLRSSETLALAHGAGPTAGPLRPLVDWRALVAAPVEPDEAFAIVPGDPADPATIAAVATATDRGPYPTLLAAGLLVRPFQMGGRQTLRAVQSPVTDPVSFALARDESVARFPNVPGWSVRHSARRAVAEHGAWLAARRGRPLEPTVTALGMLVTAARASLLHESLEAGAPELMLTVDATLDALGGGAAVDAARAAYHELAVSWQPVPPAVLEDLRHVVERLPAYSSGSRVAEPAP